MMKVGISTYPIEPTLNRGIVDGIGHYTKQLLNELPKQGVEVKGYAFKKFFKKRKLLYGNMFPYSFPTHFLLSRFKLKHELKDVDIFHSTDFKVIPMNVPVVANIWDATYFVNSDWLSSKTKNIFRKIVLRKSARYADRVIAVSEHATKDLQHYFGIDESRISIIPCCISDVWLKQNTPDEINQVLSKHNINAPYILSVGTLIPRKNFLRTIDAFLALPKDKNLKLVIVGKYGWRAMDVLKKISSYKNVIWLNNIDCDEELRCLYQGARALVFPSLYEGFGLPVLEAFASKIPVVTSNTTSIPEVCGDAAIKVNPLKTEEIRDGLVQVLSDDSTAKELVSKGSERVKLFNEQNMLHKIIKLYKKIISG